VLGGIQIPGMPENITMTELLNSDIFEKYVSEGYLSKEQLEKTRSEIKKVQKQMPEVRQDMLKLGVKYQKGKYLGCESLYLEAKNPVPRPKSKLKSNSFPIKSNSGTGMGTGGGSGYTILDPLPKTSESYREKIIFYQAILVKNFVISGSLLWTVASLPSGTTPCYSLSKTKQKTHFISDGGIRYKYIYIVPIVSNIAKEGYFYREEVEKIIKEIIARLSI